MSIAGGIPTESERTDNDPSAPEHYASANNHESLNDTVFQSTTHQHQEPKRFSLRWPLLLLLFLSLAVALLRPQSNRVLGMESPAIGKPAPRLDLVGLTDQPMIDRLDETPQGYLTLIHFWGTWCGPCKLEYPQLASMAARRQESPGFRFVSVSCEAGRGETFEGLRQKTQSYLASVGFTGIAYADPQGITRRSVADRLERNSMFYPTSILVDADGRIVGVWEGYTPESVAQIDKLIDNFLTRAITQT